MTDFTWSQYKAARNKATSLIKQAKGNTVALNWTHHFLLNIYGET